MIKQIAIVAILGMVLTMGVAVLTTQQVTANSHNNGNGNNGVGPPGGGPGPHGGGAGPLLDCVHHPNVALHNPNC